MAMKGKDVAGRPPRGKTAAKGKEGAGKENAASAGKRKSVASPGRSENARGSKRNRSSVLQFFDEAALDAEIDDALDGDSEDEMDLDFIDEIEKELEGSNKAGSVYHQPFVLKEEDLSDDELERLLKQRFGSEVLYADDIQDTKDSNQRVHLMSSTKEPTIWRAKCVIGRERQLAFSLMQKFVSLQLLGTKWHVLSAFALDHIKGYIYVEADRESNVIEACKGICSIYSSRLELVLKHEVPHLLAFRNKLNAVSKGSWVRIKYGIYKGDLAQVVAVDDVKKRATVKMIPRIDLKAIALKLGGCEMPATSSVPAPRLISSHELKDFHPHIQYKRDSQTGEVFEIFDGLMLKDGYLYKNVSIASLNCWEIKPSAAEAQKFTLAEGKSDDSDWLSEIYGGSIKSRPEVDDNMLPGVSKSGLEKGGNAYELHALVLFGRKEFGVIVEVGKDYFKILKGDVGRQDTVNVKLEEIKNVIPDKKFTARDSQKNIISISDSIKILKGPFKAREGIVKHIYKGFIFIFDYDLLENGGIFCAKPEFCRIIKYQRDAYEDDGLAPPGFEKSKESPTLSPGRVNERHERSKDFSNTPKDGAHSFSIGQTLRIRKGPLKGHLCRVVAIYRSDITVKLDSPMKVLTVNSELLSETGVKSFANFSRDSIHNLSGSGFTVEHSDADPFGGFVSYSDPNAGKSDAADPWGSNANLASTSKGMDGWEKGNSSTGGQNMSLNNVNGDSSDAIKDQSGEKIAHGWEATEKAGVGCGSSGGWNNPSTEAGSWGAAREGSKNKLASESQVDPANELSGWDKKTVSANEIDQWKKSENNWEKERAEISIEKDGCNGNNISTWDSASNQGKLAANEPHSSWERNEGNTENKTDSWGKTLETQVSRASIKNQDESWCKASGSEIGGSGIRQSSPWGNTTAGSGSQADCWDNGSARRDQQGVTCGNETGQWSNRNDRNGSSSQSWDKSKFMSEGAKADGMNEGGSFGQGQSDVWNKSQPLGNVQASNWDKPKDAIQGKAMGWDQAGSAAASWTDSWSKPNLVDGVQSSSWDEGKNANDDMGSKSKAWNSSNDAGGWKSDWNKMMAGSDDGGESSHKSWKQPNSFGVDWRGGRGGCGGRGGGHQNHDDACDWNKNTTGSDDIGAESSNKSWNQSNAFGEDWRGGQRGGRGWRGGRRGGNRNHDDSSDGGWKSDWNKGMTGGDDFGGENNNKSWNQSNAFGEDWRGGRTGGRGGRGGRRGGYRNHDDAFDGSQGGGRRGRGRGRGNDSGRPFGRGWSSDQSGDQGNPHDQDSDRPFSGGWSSNQTTGGWSSNQSRDQGNPQDRDGAFSDWNSDRASSWKEKGSDGDRGSGWSKGWSTGKEATFGGGSSCDWTKDAVEERGNKDLPGNQSGWKEGAGSWNDTKAIDGVQPAAGLNSKSSADDRSSWDNCRKDSGGEIDKWSKGDDQSGSKSFGWKENTGTGEQWGSDSRGNPERSGGHQSSGWNQKRLEDKDGADGWKLGSGGLTVQGANISGEGRSSGWGNEQCNNDNEEGAKKSLFGDPGSSSSWSQGTGANTSERGSSRALEGWSKDSGWNSMCSSKDGNGSDGSKHTKGSGWN